jgi:hypothetical protein
MTPFTDEEWRRSFSVPWTPPPQLSLDKLEALVGIPRVWLRGVIELMAWPATDKPGTSIERNRAFTALAHAARRTNWSVFIGSLDRVKDEPIPPSSFDFPRMLGPEDNSICLDVTWNSDEQFIAECEGLSLRTWLNVRVDGPWIAEWLRARLSDWESLYAHAHWTLGTVVSWIIWGDPSLVNRISDYISWAHYGERALKAWQRVLVALRCGELLAIESGPGRWLRVPPDPQGASITFLSNPRFAREDVLKCWPPEGEPTDAISIQKDVGTPADAKPVKPAPDSKICFAIRAAYDNAEAEGVKAPNIKELPVFVRRLLERDGVYASGRKIQELGERPEFKRRRRPPGRTVRSEQAGRMK